NVPGRERFYTRVEGPLTYAAWLEGVRRRRTFVTNGPLLEFSINGADIGDEIRLERPGKVRVSANVSFDPAADDVTHVELIENGVVVHSIPRRLTSTEIAVDLECEITESAWLALRVTGAEVSEPIALAARRSHQPNCAAHSGPIYVTVAAAEPLWAHPRSRDVAPTWLARLADLVARSSDDLLV